MVQETVGKLGRLDIRFANAGISEPDLPITDIEDYPNELWQRLISVTPYRRLFNGYDCRQGNEETKERKHHQHRFLWEDTHKLRSCGGSLYI